MIHERRDALTGAARDAIMISPEDAATLSVADGDRIILYNDVGQFAGRAFIAPVRQRNLQVHWPEGNVLIDRRRRSPGAGMPDYNATVWVATAEELASLDD